MSQSVNLNENQCENVPPKSENNANELKNSIKERKKIRRAFSMPRSIPFRLSVSRRKNNQDSSAINETNKQINVNTDPAASIASDNNCCSEPTKTKNFRRSWKKFLSRVAQQMTSINIGVSGSDILLRIMLYKKKSECLSLPLHTEHIFTKKQPNFFRCYSWFYCLSFRYIQWKM